MLDGGTSSVWDEEIHTYFEACLTFDGSVTEYRLPGFSSPEYQWGWEILAFTSISFGNPFEGSKYRAANPQIFNVQPH